MKRTRSSSISSLQSSLADKDFACGFFLQQRFLNLVSRFTVLKEGREGVICEKPISPCVRRCGLVLGVLLLITGVWMCWKVPELSKNPSAGKPALPLT
jgi:hypothetical protein